MTLEQLVTDLATSQRLRDAGFPQDTAMVWIKTAWGLHVVENGDSVNRSFTLCAAPTLSELLDVLEPSQSSAEKMVALAHALIALHEEVTG